MTDPILNKCMLMIDLDGGDIERVQKTCRGWAVYLMTIHMGR